MIEKWQCYQFSELSTSLLYNILSLRQEVFIVEQNCVYLDADGYYDHCALHLCGFDHTGHLIAYSRIIAPSIKYSEPSIGRVVVAPTARRKGIGEELMKQSIKFCNNHYPNCSIRISAQSHLEQLYATLGFQSVGEPYMEDGIPHIEMLLS
ncbi:MAG: GNAT family N-acetyltransferase [Bacteroidetes bacterium]|nr:GNAT family N-acetyltransferase [Bacteroidota bacterium]